jgi:ABC-type sugar transport system substrate-binding protein
MTKSHFARLAVLLLLLSPSVFASAEDLTGKWSGTFVVTVGEQPAKEDNAYMIATQKGADLTGSIGPNESEQYPILKGKIATVKEAGKDVTKVSFDVQPDNGPDLAHCELSIVDGHLKGKLTAEHDGQKISAVLDLTRVK